jgi:hypothetical protein
MDEFYANSLDEVIRFVLQIEKTNPDNLMYFRGETKDRKEQAISPSVYREGNLKKEEYFYRETQRFNEEEFLSDKTTFDKLSRMQHYSVPTRMIDISEDLISSMFFALEEKDNNDNSVVYVMEMDKHKIKYYDSDAVSVVSNMAKIPMSEEGDKTKERLRSNAYDYTDIESFNRCNSVKFLLHEIKEEKPQFENIIDPKHIFSIFCVKPKYTNKRISNQKGAFLLFGLNKSEVEKPIELLVKNGDTIELNSDLKNFSPISKITKIIIDSSVQKGSLHTLGITKPYIYPDLEKVSEWLKSDDA